MARDPERDALLAAGQRAVNAILSTPEFVAVIAEREIEQRIQQGQLLPVASLQLAPGLELVPVGVVAELRAALHELATHPAVAKIKALKDMTAVAVALATSNHTPAGGSEKTPAAARPVGTVPPAVPDDDEAAAGVGDTDPPVEPVQSRGRPTAIPEGPQPCTWDGCDETVDERQVRFSMCRFRRVLCLEHHRTFKPVAA